MKEFFVLSLTMTLAAGTATAITAGSTTKDNVTTTVVGSGLCALCGHP